MDSHTIDWTMTNEHGLDLIGNTDVPDTEAKACLVLVHGFKGYKDYGFIPVLAKELAESGILVHRFNLSCSGMTNEIETFARTDLFALDTWTKQVEDVRCVLRGIENGVLIGKDLPMFLCGHSRGGATVLMVAGREGRPHLSGVITINAVDACGRLSDDQHQEMINNGFLITESARTNQSLRINSTWLQEQLDDPANHDVLGLCKDIKCPALVFHGTADDAVDYSCGERIGDTIGCGVKAIEGGNHVLNMANPAPADGQMSPQLQEVATNITSFVIANHTKTPI